VPTLLELAGASDILINAASGGAQSRGIVDRAVMDAPGPDGILVNVARGTVVDEPNVPAALLTIGHVVLQPHCASATVETRIAMGELVLANLAAHFSGKTLPSAVV